MLEETSRFQGLKRTALWNKLTRSRVHVVGPRDGEWSLEFSCRMEDVHETLDDVIERLICSMPNFA